MPQALSPGVTVVEKDFTQIVPAVSTSIGAFCGAFPWGPVSQPTRVSSETDLVSRFGRPVNINKQYQSFFTVANFLAYTNNILVTRAETAHARNAVSIQKTQAGSITSIPVTSAGSGYTTIPTIGLTSNPDTYTTVGTVTATLKVISAEIVSGHEGTDYTTGDVVTISIKTANGDTEATFTLTATDGVVTGVTVSNAGIYSLAPSDTTAIAVSNITVSNPAATGLQLDLTLGVNSIVITSGGDYSEAPTVSISGGGGTGATLGVVQINRQINGLQIKNTDDYITNYSSGINDYGMFAAKFPGTKGNGIRVIMIDHTSWANLTSSDSVYPYRGQRPGTSDFAAKYNIVNDEIHVIILDTPRGTFTGTANGIIERFEFLSVLSDAQLSDGTDNYYKNVINNSGMIWWLKHPTTTITNSKADWGSLSEDAAGKTMQNLTSTIVSDLSGGVDDLAVTDGDIQNAYALLTNTEQYDISLVMTGNVSASTAQTIVQNVCEVRKDCIAFLSPNDSGNPIIGVGSDATNKISAYKNAVALSSSYAVMDSGFKYQYDRYNDVYHWIPLNGDIAGLCARTDNSNDAWWSPGGFNRGQIKNVVKLGFNPNKSDRDTLYVQGINPVTAFPGEGIVLFGDKTMLAKPSAFDRINVRRLFIVLEKAIAKAAQYQLFEFNDEFTRAQFRSMVEPYLRDVQGRRGITEFRVAADQRNNTPEVIDRNEFVADIYIKPARSINFITLNFVATRTGVSFEEIGG